MKEICEQCGKKTDCEMVGYDLLCMQCGITKENAQARTLDYEREKDRKAYQKLTPEQKAELESEYALAGVQDAGEWFGY